MRDLSFDVALYNLGNGCSSLVFLRDETDQYYPSLSLGFTYIEALS